MVSSDNKKNGKKDTILVIDKSEKKKIKKTTLPQKYMNGVITQKEFEQLVEVAVVIQKHWRGYVDRVRVHN